MCASFHGTKLFQTLSRLLFQRYTMQIRHSRRLRSKSTMRVKKTGRGFSSLFPFSWQVVDRNRIRRNKLPFHYLRNPRKLEVVWRDWISSEWRDSDLQCLFRARSPQQSNWRIWIVGRDRKRSPRICSFSFLFDLRFYWHESRHFDPWENHFKWMFSGTMEILVHLFISLSSLTPKNLLT